MKNWITPQTTSDQFELTSGLIEAHDAYIEARDRKAVAPYVAPVPDIPRPDATMVILHAAKPVAALSALVAGVYVIVVTAASVGAAIAAFVTSNVAVIGGCGLAVVSLVLCFAGRGVESNKTNTQQTTATPQTINVVVNVAGQNVSNGK